MPRRDCFRLLQICLQYVSVKSNSVSIEPLQEDTIYPIYVLNPYPQYQKISDFFYLALSWQYVWVFALCYMCVTFICFIVCVLFFSCIFWLVKHLSCLITPKRNLNFEFENVVCKTTAVLFRSQCVKSKQHANDCYQYFGHDSVTTKSNFVERVKSR